MDRASRPLLVVISGPSGAGKDTVVQGLKDRGHSWHFAVTATTRPRRSGERDGVDYYFLDPDQFQVLLDQEGLLEHAMVYGHWYGAPRVPVEAALARGADVIVKTDVQGARTLRSRFPQSLLIFLAPSSRQELEGRLRRRRTETEADLEHRLRVAEAEMAQQGEFHHVVVNRENHPEEAIGEIEAIVRAAKERG